MNEKRDALRQIVEGYSVVNTVKKLIKIEDQDLLQKRGQGSIFQSTTHASEHQNYMSQPFRQMMGTAQSKHRRVVSQRVQLLNN